MAGITFDELWEDLKNENEENREIFQTAEDIAKIINRLVEERVRQGLSQRELAKRCGMKQTAIARLESIKTMPRMDTILKVAKALKLEVQLVEIPETTDIVYVDTNAMFHLNQKQNYGQLYNQFNNLRPALA